MLRKRNLFVVKQHLAVLIRSLTSTEVSTALRPFYFSVHPDLFGQHPKERAINETSLQQLSSVLQSLQTAKYLPPVTLPFYIKNRIGCFSNRNNQHEAARLIKIYLKGRDLASAIVNILKACDLPTNHVQQYIKAEPRQASGFRAENIRQDGDEWVRVKYQNEFDFTQLNKNHPLYATFVMQQKMREARGSPRLKHWLELHFEDALAKASSGSASKEEIQRLKVEMIEKSKLKDIRWECGWNSQHFRGCLLSLQSLMEQHPQHMRQLEDQILVFSSFTGISLDGHLMLFSGEVRHNWLDFIKNIRKHKLALGRVPFYEKSLSHVLKNIKVSRRKFMPDMKVSEYEINLKQLTTAVSDYFGRNSHPKNWPDSMDHYEIVVESEAGPMMVSPTGQFIVPSSIPGPLLINFISANFDDANDRIDHYKKDKVMEKSLHRRCMEELHLAALLKDDNITPELMIQFCQKLLDRKTDLESVIKGENSVLSMGPHTLPVPTALFALNRQRLADALRKTASDSIVLLQGGEEVSFYDTDTTYNVFRQESYFMWAFGVTDPGCFGAVDVKTGESYLFIARLPQEYAVWMGPLPKTSDYAKKYDIKKVFYVDELEGELRRLQRSKILTLKGVNSDSGLAAQPATFEGIEKFSVDDEALFPVIASLRVYKTELEIRVIKYVVAVSSYAHRQVMKQIRPGNYEYQGEAQFLNACYEKGGCRHVSYTCICGSGPNGAILHYGHAGAPNNAPIKNGDMCLFDMGANYFGYAADITCSFPANGKFTADQKLIYEAVLRATLAVHAAAKPGVSWVDMHVLANRVVLEDLKKGGLLTGSVDEMLEAGLGAVFQPHGLGHLLGLDVHDVGGYLQGQPERPQHAGVNKLRTARVLEKGMVLTVEPGCYFIDPLLDKALADPALNKFLVAEAIERFRSFGGVRIEDDVLITEHGVEDLTRVPRTVQEIEGWMNGRLDEARFRDPERLFVF